MRALSTVLLAAITAAAVSAVPITPSHARCRGGVYDWAHGGCAAKIVPYKR